MRCDGIATIIIVIITLCAALGKKSNCTHLELVIFISNY